MITKETFCAALGQILEQREIDEKVGVALESVGDGHFVFGCKNRYLTALLLVLKEAVNDQYDYIDWWLYDASPDYKVWTEDGTKEWCLKEPGALKDCLRRAVQHGGGQKIRPDQRCHHDRPGLQRRLLPCGQRYDG